MGSRKIRIIFENPNTPEETCEYLSKILAEKIAADRLKGKKGILKNELNDKI